MVPSSATAQSVDIVERETEGSGRSSNEAIINALVEAVRQINGLTIDAESGFRSLVVETESRVNFLDATSVDIAARTKGAIAGYEVLSINNESNRWLAKLLVKVPKYKSPGLDRAHLRSVAIIPFHSTTAVRTEMGRRWEQNLVTHFVQSRRFRVLDREFETDLRSEQARLVPGQTPVAELARIGQKVGADYVIVGEITRFGLKTASNPNFVEEASLSVEYRVIEVALQEIRWASAATCLLSDDVLRRNGLSGDRHEALNELLKSGADIVATQVLDAIYPVKVLKVQEDGTVLLTQGGARAQAGQLVTIHSGEEITTDPDTGLPIRLDGSELALATITKVREKYSEAKLQRGKPDALKVGMICRRLTPEQMMQMQVEAQQALLLEQDILIKDGKCPPISIRSMRVARNWNLVVRNVSTNALRINALNRRIGGTFQEGPFNLVVQPGGEESFGLPYPFATTDAIEVNCDRFERPYVFFFP